jgi:ABC-type transport system involved in multi-copper enzyme maturation permease subunit
VRLPLRYAGWQLRDFVLGRLPQLLVIGGLLGAQLLLPLRIGGGGAWTTTLAPAVAAAAATLAAQLPMVLTLLAVQGVVSADRRSGHYRLLFSKPVSVAGYYAQSFLVNALGVLLGAAALFLLFVLLVRPAPALPFLSATLLVYVVVGGLGLLLSAVTRLDWIVLVLLWGTAALVQGAWSVAGGWRALVAGLLPPAQAVSELQAALHAGGALDPRSVAWALGYAALCLALALVVLRRRPLGA